MLKITDVNTEDIHLLWPRVRDQLQLAIDRNQGEFELEDVHLKLLTGFMHLWIAYDKKGVVIASAVCEMKMFPQRKICYIVLLGGTGLTDWSWAIDYIEDWALQNGADAIAAYTRRGFAKVMKDYGYNEAYTVIHKELTDRRLH